MIGLLGNRRALLRTIREIDLFDRDDRPLPQTGHLHVPQGRFNAGQKVNACSPPRSQCCSLSPASLLWYGERDTRFRLQGTVYLHDALMYLSVALVIGHLYLAVIHPATRHCAARDHGRRRPRRLGNYPSRESGSKRSPPHQPIPALGNGSLLQANTRRSNE